MKYYIFGAGSNVFGILKFFGLENIIAIVDNDKDKIGTQLKRLDIISFNDLLKRYNNEMIIISVTNYYQGIKNQLEENGITNYYCSPKMIESYYEISEICNWLKSINRKIIFYGIDPWSIRYCELLKQNNMAYLLKGIYVGDSDVKGLKQGLVAKGDIDSTDIIIKTGNNQQIDLKNEVCDLFNFHGTHSFVKQNENLELYKFKNLYKGQKCFIIGNGPSLLHEDLEKIEKNSFISFGCNRIYKIYKTTKWRADYYCVVDLRLIDSIKDDIQTPVAKKGTFAKEFYYDALESINHLGDLYRFKELWQDVNNEEFKFADDIRKGIYQGFTVAYVMLQIAVYMGFKEIYLLGVDFTFVAKQDGKQHFYENDNVDVFDPIVVKNLYKNDLLKAYRAAKRYADNSEIKIFNATRGGELEIFERVSFDSIC